MRPAAAAVLAASALAAFSGCGSAARHRVPASSPIAAQGASGGFAIGLTEDNAALLWDSRAAFNDVVASGAGPGGASSAARRDQARLALAREQLSALHPRYLRLLVDWAALQPDPRRAPDLQAGASGCARSTPPCAAYAGIREELAAIASQQRAAHGAGGAGAGAGPPFEVVIVIFGTPSWAAQPASGCERGSRGAFSRPPTPSGLAAYRGLIHELVALGAREGAALDWWSPWNEPNDPTFLSPQRSSCAAGAPAVSPSAYAELARAMAAQLRAEGGRRHLLVGELNAYQTDALDRVSIVQFVAALPADVLCLGDTYAVHAYASRGRSAPANDPVAVLEAALDARGGCARGARVWVTEAGAGASHPGMPRAAGAGEAKAGCLALATQLAAWDRDPRVGAVFQYSFRDDPAFPVGLIDAQLSRVYPVYRLWLAWERAREAGRPAPAPVSACGP